MKKGTNHNNKLVALNRIEGQVRGIQNMITEGRYCIDIINVVSATIGALRKVEASILQDHLQACVLSAFAEKSDRQIKEKIDEVCTLLNKLHR
ncbi:MAG: hypothetical protein ACD_62C00385G0004 [uncultured bacterium]|nr:MAG: hypothetical protein ACD_62C00385G0004 [uncultured bacterium]HLD44560.1 metal-sensitive transcriptional regulator [bacterium]